MTNPEIKTTLTSVSNAELYHLYRNTFDDTYVIVKDDLKDLLYRTLTNMGSSPELVHSDYSVIDLQIMAIQLGSSVDIISLN